MKRTLAPFAFALALGFMAPPASAQTPPLAPSPAADATMAAQKEAFLALPETTRKAAQEALVWLGLYVGVNDGEFGRHTRDAILAFQGNLKAPTDGALSPLELKALLAAAQTAREAAGFQIVSDPRSGARIGAPLKLISARGGARLDFASSADADLNALYARLSAPSPARKIVYKAIKPDSFFVVSGQDGAAMFYTRFDKNAAANPPLRGFTFAYPATYPAPQAALLNRVAIAVANSFEPFPGAAAAPPASMAAAGGAPPPQPISSPPPVPGPAATALMVAPGKALTALKVDGCRNPTVAGKPARIERADAATGLTLLAGDFGSSREAPRFGQLTQDVVVLGFAGQRLAASSASFTGGEARAHGDRGGGQERRRRTGVRSTRSARWPRGADPGRAQARRWRRAGGRPRRHRAGCDPRFPRRRRIRI